MANEIGKFLARVESVTGHTELRSPYASMSSHVQLDFGHGATVNATPHSLIMPYSVSPGIMCDRTVNLNNMPEVLEARSELCGNRDATNGTDVGWLKGRAHASVETEIEAERLAPHQKDFLCAQQARIKIKT